MSAGNEWSREEVEAIVADYFHMLTQELAGQQFNKTAHRSALQKKLNNRSDGSIERKHQNISAVLIELGFHVPATKIFREDLVQFNFNIVLVFMFEDSLLMPQSRDEVLNGMTFHFLFSLSEILTSGNASMSSACGASGRAVPRSRNSPG